MGKKTHARTMAEYIAEHGPATKKELLAACGVKPTSCGSYFATVKERAGFYYEPSHYDRLAKSSLVAFARYTLPEYRPAPHHHMIAEKLEADRKSTRLNSSH